MASCPICERPANLQYRPFCSKRCADVDLSRWLNGAYAIPDAEDEDGGDTSAPEPEAADADAPRRRG